MATSDAPGAHGGGLLKQAGWVGPAADRLKQEVMGRLRAIVSEMVADPGTPRWEVLADIASPEDLVQLIDSPPTELVAAVAPVLCPTLEWVRMFDSEHVPAKSKLGRETWRPSEGFEVARRALQNGWYEDALVAFRRAVDEENSEDFVSLYGLAQLQIHWEGTPEAALPLLDRSARYAVPVNATPWMKRFASESFLARSWLLASLHGDFVQARQHLDNAETLTYPRPEIDIMRARIAALEGDRAAMVAAIRKTVTLGWLYALQVVLDPHYPHDVAPELVAALREQKTGVQQEANARASRVRELVAAALAEDDGDVAPADLAEAKARCRKAADLASTPMDAEGVALLRALAIGAQSADLEKEAGLAVEALRELRHTILEHRERDAASQQLVGLQARREELGVRRQQLVDAVASAEKRLQGEEQEALKKAQRDTIRRAVNRVIWLVAPVLVILLAYHYTEVKFDPFTIGWRSAGAAASPPPSAGGGVARPPSSGGGPAVGPGRSPGVAPSGAAGKVTKGQLAPPPTAGPQPSGGASGAQGAGPEGPSYHIHLDRWVWFAFFLYLLAVIGLVARSEWLALEIRTRALGAEYHRLRGEQIKELERKQGPVEDEFRSISQRMDELRAKL